MIKHNIFLILLFLDMLKRLINFKAEPEESYLRAKNYSIKIYQ